MSSLIRWFSILVCVITAYGCSAPAEREAHGEFFQCWQISRVENSTYEFNFDALVFPREGVIAHNAACPNLSIKMKFYNLVETPSFDPFRRADANPLEVVGIRGRAVVTIAASQESADVMTVRVTRVIGGVILNETETRRLLAAITR